jgi:glycosyltransferase involved in cell wall biosynthesis
MRLLIVTDTWHPQVNGVLRSLLETARAARALGHRVEFLNYEGLPTVALPHYQEIRLAVPRPSQIARRIEAARPDAIHIATEGTIGHLARRHCLAAGRPFTTSFHTRLPDYISARMPFPERWTEYGAWAWLRRFHAPSAGVFAATQALADELAARRFRNVLLSPFGVDTGLFRPRPGAELGLPRPVFLSVGRVALEKNLEAFLALDLPGSKVVVGDGPARADLAARFPGAHFLGVQRGAALAATYAAADVFVFPSRTDTFGLVLLEALASGLPVAAYPVAGPRDVIGSAPVGALDGDLRAACLRALSASRAACREFALGMSWEASARQFLANVTRANAVTCSAEPAMAA